MELTPHTSAEESLARALDADHVVVVGASNRSSNAGLSFVRALRAARFSGRLSVVNRDGDSVLGATGHRDLAELAIPPDLVILSLPADRVEDALAAAIGAGASAVHVFSGGFAERGDPARAEQQERLAAMAEDAGIALIGPNCMGLYRPSAGLAFRADQPMLSGPVSIVSQSGGVAIACVHQLAARDVGVSTVVSFGNGAQMRAGRIADALTRHGEEGVLGVYVESANEPDLLERLERLAKSRPVVLCVGTSSPTATAAAALHTGAPGGPWAPPGSAAGVVVASTLEAFTAALDRASRQPAPADCSIALLTISGGVGVLLASAMEQHGLTLAELDEHTKTSIEGIIPGGLLSAANPVDLGASYLSRKVIARSLAALTADENVELILFHLIWDHLVDVERQAPGYADGFLQLLQDHADQHHNLAVYLPRMVDDEDERFVRRRLRRAGITVFETVNECVGGLAGPGDTARLDSPSVNDARSAL